MIKPRLDEPKSDYLVRAVTDGSPVDEAHTLWDARFEVDGYEVDDADRTLRSKGGQFAGSKPGSGTLNANNAPESMRGANANSSPVQGPEQEFQDLKQSHDTEQSELRTSLPYTLREKDRKQIENLRERHKSEYRELRSKHGSEHAHHYHGGAPEQDAVSFPVAEGIPEWLSPQALSVHPSMQYRRGTVEQLGARKAFWDELQEKDEPYDVDRGGTLIGWRDSNGETYVVDGHHRRLHALTAKQFISSSGGGERATRRLLPCRILNESDGWTLEMASDFGKSLNQGDAGEHWITTKGGAHIQVGGKSKGSGSVGGTIPSESVPKGASSREVASAQASSAHSALAETYRSKHDEMSQRHGNEKYDQMIRHGNEKQAVHNAGASGEVMAPQHYKQNDELADRHKQEESAHAKEHISAYHATVKEHGGQRSKVHERELSARYEHLGEGHTIKTDSDDAVSDSFEDFFTCDEFTILSGDAKGGLMRVRQKATRADSVNRNRRLYPREIMQAAIDRANPRAEAGAMLSEWEHPARANTANGECFVDNPDSKTARVDAISGVGADGWVYVDRTILSTKSGKELAKRYRDGEKVGISTRFRVRGGSRQVGGSSVFVADHMEIFTFDDVSNPAVDGAGDFRLLTDSELSELKRAPEADDPFDGEPNNTSNGVETDTQRRSRREQEYNSDMKNLRGLLTALAATIAVGDAAQVNEANKLCADGLRDAYREDKDVSHLVPRYRELVADATEKISGFHSGAESPQATLGNEMGTDPTSGWGASELHKKTGANGMVTAGTSTTSEGSDKGSMKADEAAEVLDFVRAQKAKEAEEKAAKDHSEAVEARLSGILGDEAHPLNKLEQDARDSILETVRKVAPKPDDVLTLVDSLVKPISEAAAKATLSARGYGGGQTVNNPANPLSQVTRVNEPVPVMASVDRMVSAVDDMLRDNLSMAHEHGWTDPEGIGGDDEKRRREVCRKMAEPIMEQVFGTMASRLQLGGDALGEDSLLREAGALSQSMLGGDTYTSVVASMNNQPTIMLWLLMQAFQDMRFMEFAGAIGPGVSAGAGIPGWEEQRGVGRVFRVPSETYVAPSGYGQEANWDHGLAVGQDGEIPEQNVNIYWDTFFPTPKKIATSATYEAIRAIGNGPLNYPTIARALFHMAARKSRTVDTSLGNEMVNTALEFGAVTQTVEAYTTGGVVGLDLADNSVGVASGALTVNLNPEKIASAAVVAATDKFRIYGTGNGSTGIAPVAGLRLKSGGGSGVAGTGTHYSRNAVGPTPIVPPRATLTLTGPGADSAGTLNPITVSLPAAQVLGWLGSDGNIYSTPGTTATCAVDWANGVLLFIAGQVTVAASLITTATSVAYSYATNFDYFVTTDAMVANLLATGETEQAYYNRLVAKLDSVAAAMGSSTNYVKPDLSIMSLNAAAKALKATIWYALNSPKGSELYPNETYFATRNGIGMARVNAPWWIGDNGILIGRKGTTKYAIDSPFEIRGPFVKYGTNGLFVAGEGYYGAENSAIFTPQVKDINGAVKNSVSRMLMLY